MRVAQLRGVGGACFCIYSDSVHSLILYIFWSDRMAKIWEIRGRDIAMDSTVSPLRAQVSGGITY